MTQKPSTFRIVLRIILYRWLILFLVSCFLLTIALFVHFAFGSTAQSEVFAFFGNPGSIRSYVELGCIAVVAYVAATRLAIRGVNTNILDIQKLQIAGWVTLAAIVEGYLLFRGRIIIRWWTLFEYLPILGIEYLALGKPLVAKR